METECGSIYTATQHWKKPDEVMKLRKNRKSLNMKRTPQKRALVTSLSPKRCKPNPFKTKNSEIKQLDKENKIKTSSHGNLLKEIEKGQRIPLRHQVENILQGRPLSPIKVNIPSFDDFPTDWSIKLRVRFTSQNSFLWCSPMKSFEEASGITNFARCSTNDTNLSQQAMFQQCLMQWVHPDTALTATNLTESVLSSIRQQWSTSFSSVYHLYQAGMCPYFYVIAQNFVILFLLKGFAGTLTNTVLITPTTTGLRKALRSEGITFNMPLIETKSDSEGDTSDVLVGSDDDDNALWMDSMGIMQGQTTIIPTLDSSQLDYRPSSLVQIEDTQIHAFFNYFLNYQLGHTVGMPAIISSPIAFEGGVLRSLKYQPGKAREYKSKKRYKEMHYLEITGNIMPQQLTQLCRLMRQTQDGEYSATMSTHTFTTAFNFPRKCDLQKNEPSSSIAGLSADDVKHFTMASSLDKKSLQQLHCSNNKYSWDV